MSEIRHSQVQAIDNAHRALAAAGDDRSHPDFRRADAVLNRVVQNSSLDEIRAWASTANERSGLTAR